MIETLRAAKAAYEQAEAAAQTLAPLLPRRESGLSYADHRAAVEARLEPRQEANRLFYEWEEAYPVAVAALKAAGLDYVQARDALEGIVPPCDRIEWRLRGAQPTETGPQQAQRERSAF